MASDNNKLLSSDHAVVGLDDHHEQGIFSSQQSTFQRHRNKWITGALVAVLIVLAIVIIVPLAVLSKPEKFQLYKKLKVENTMNHLKEFEKIAMMPENRGSRSVVDGYTASANYVQSQLHKLTCDSSIQTFMVPIWTEINPTELRQTTPLALTYQNLVDFRALRYGGNFTGTISGPIFVPSGTGCLATDYADANNTGDWIALAQFPPSSSCSLIDAAMVAQTAGASGLIFHNTATETNLRFSRVRGSGWFPGDPLITIPVLSMSYSVGRALATTVPPPQLTLVSDMKIEIVETFNVYCDTRHGSADNLIVIGAHLDSVPEGPGINDNGSGSATVLEICMQWHRSGVKTHNKVRFAWWGGEEIGLLGSRHYVKDLMDNNPEAWEKLALNLNFDMQASPNAVPGILDGNTAPTAQTGSIKISQLFETFFNKTLKSPIYRSSMNGGSDYYPFVLENKPAGGLAAGAGGIKNEVQREQYGGLANAPYDPCYHLSCDTVMNIDKNVLERNGKAAAYVLQKVADMKDVREWLQKPEE